MDQPTEFKQVGDILARDITREELIKVNLTALQLPEEVREVLEGARKFAVEQTILYIEETLRDWERAWPTRDWMLQPGKWFCNCLRPTYSADRPQRCEVCGENPFVTRACDDPEKRKAIIMASMKHRGLFPYSLHNEKSLAEICRGMLSMLHNTRHQCSKVLKCPLAEPWEDLMRTMETLMEDKGWTRELPRKLLHPA